MIDARELRLGNLLLYNGYVAEVSNIGCNGFETHKTRGILYGSCDLADYKPIPLTEQWLLDFGFEKGHKLYLSPDKSSDEGFFTTMCYNLWEKDFIINENDYDCRHINCEYVHQLQNLYFALTGKELTKK